MKKVRKRYRSLSERFADKKASITAGGQRRDVGISSRKSQKSVVRRCAVFEYSESRRRFYSGFCEAKEIRMMRVDEITEGSRVKWLENRSNIESAQSEVCRTRIWFDVATEKKEYTKIRITSAQTA